jgi:hypothetical protein
MSEMAHMENLKQLTARTRGHTCDIGHDGTPAIIKSKAEIKAERAANQAEAAQRLAKRGSWR